MIGNMVRRTAFVAAALSLCALAVFGIAAFSGCDSDAENKVEGVYVVDEGADSSDNAGNLPENDDGAADDAEKSDADNAADGEVEGLEIPLEDFTSTAKFYGVYVGETYMQIIYVKYGDSYRTAFNTCQVCYGSPRAYYKQSGNYLVCQNCKSRVAMSSVGVSTQTLSCNPFPILESDRVQTADAIIIPNDYLVGCKNLFKNWGGSIT